MLLSLRPAINILDSFHPNHSHSANLHKSTLMADLDSKDIKCALTRSSRLASQRKRQPLSRAPITHTTEEGYFKTGWEQQALMTFGAAAFRFQLFHDTSIKLPSEGDETTLPKVLLLSLSGAAETLKTFSPAYTPITGL